MLLELKEPTERVFRRALGRFVSGVTVISVWADDLQPRGMTASAFSSVSTTPPLILICLDRRARTYDEIDSRGRFGVNILSQDARDISIYCAQPGEDKHLVTDWLIPGADTWSPPILGAALAYLDCDVHEVASGGTHAVVLGKVRTIAVAQRELDPLVYFNGNYRELADAS